MMSIIQKIIEQHGENSTTVQVMQQFFPMIARAEAAIKSDRQQQQLTLDGVYTQRNALAIAFAKAAIAAGWVAGRGFDSDTAKDWSDDWRHVVYVDLPDGRQASWHMSPECVPLLDGLPEYTGVWDGTSIAQDAEWCQFSYDRQLRGEPVGYIDKHGMEALTEFGLSARVCPHENIETIPVYTSPQPTPVTAQPSDAHRKLKERTEYLLRGHKAIFNQGPKKADLQKHIKTLDAENDRLRALLARYGHPVEPEGW